MDEIVCKPEMPFHVFRVNGIDKMRGCKCGQLVLKLKHFRIKSKEDIELAVEFVSQKELL